jgi:hypothetical protein
MLDLQTIKERALALARERLGGGVSDVIVREDVDFQGHKSLRVTILMKATWQTSLPGEKLNDISSKLNSFLSEHGDERFAYTHYMTTREFSESNDRRKSTVKRRSRAG